MGRAYAGQVREVAGLAAEALPQVPAQVWEPVAVGPESGFRNKAKMVVAGSMAQPTLGILDPRGGGIDLRDCGLHDPRIVAALPALAEHIGVAGLAPYDVATRRGELKQVHLTTAPSGDLMLRWVLRSTEPVPRLRKHLPALQRALPALRVASANIQPLHAAIPEGPDEHLLTAQEDLEIELPTAPAPLRLRLRPGGFLQTNHHVAAQLYDSAARWLRDPVGRQGLWDLYCGVGGFALAVGAAWRSAAQEANGGPSGPDGLVGVETSEEAVAAARHEAARRGIAATFVAADAGAYAAAADRSAHPGTVIVNPPRRGIGPLASWLEESAVERVLYSSCHLGSLADDLQRMPSWRVTRARVFDMFPQTAHVETAVLLERQTA